MIPLWAEIVLIIVINLEIVETANRVLSITFLRFRCRSPAFDVDGAAHPEMHLACRYGSSHNAVKLVLPRAWQINIRSFSTTPLRLARGYKHDPDSVPDGLLGSYIPNANPNPRAKNIAVIGGGVSGLATAFNLTQDIPNAKITIYEKKEKLGGWVDSEQVEVDDGSVLFEWGPRTLRPDLQGNGMATLQLVRYT